MMTKAESVFSGEDSIREFFREAEEVVTPAVELPDGINPFRASGVRIFLKLAYQNPLFNLKSYPAFRIARAAGEIGGGWIESSSGNLALSLAVAGNLYGAERVESVVDDTVSPSVERALRLFGTTVIKHPAGRDAISRSAYTAARANEEGLFYPDQYTNYRNRQAHRDITGAQLVRQFGEQLDFVAVALGSSGTVMGLAECFESYELPIRILGAAKRPGERIPGPRTLELLNELPTQWREKLSGFEEVTARKALEYSARCIRLGLLIGPSSGMALAALMQHLETLNLEMELERRDGELCCAVVCCDTPFLHLEQYFELLPESFFPPVYHSSQLPVSVGDEHR